MDEVQNPDSPDMITRSQAISALASMREDHERIYDRAVVRVHNAIHPIDHVIAAAMRRSMALIKAFLMLVDEGNEFAAMPLIRIQLDNVLRISAFRIVDDPYALAKFMLDGKNFQNFDKKKYDFSDKGLRTRLEDPHECINSLYEQTSGFVHLSREHMIRIVEDWDNPDLGEDSRIKFGALEELPTWKEKDKREALLLLCAATQFLIDEAKEVQSAERAE